MEIRELEPKQLWNKFADLNAVPRPSKHEERVIAFVMDFGERLGLETINDEVGNVLIRKPASSGMESRATIILQSHLDMVHQKNGDTSFDFNAQGIEMYVDGEWVKAKGTTLGADNGIGVAAIMAILESTTIEHPAIEALFTIDEETGMTGALGLKGGLLKGRILLNLDTEQDDEIDIGCAGGIDVTASRDYNQVALFPNAQGASITVKGLNGGHSGMDIHKGFGNANKIMNRMLYNGLVKFNIGLIEVNGGSLRNAIPRESTAIVAVDASQWDVFLNSINADIEDIKIEFKTMEPNLTIVVEPTQVSATMMEPETAGKILNSLYAAHNGVYRMSAEIPDLVETSNNVARVNIKEGKIWIGCLARSSVETSKYDLANALHATFSLAGCEVALSGAYPGWAPNVTSPILALLVQVYEQLHFEKPKVVACHAGLECGILGTNYPGMDMISFGPTILGAHSPDERANIISVQKFWKYLLEIVRQIPSV